MIHAEVLVVGEGPAGVLAALRAGDLGARTMFTTHDARRMHREALRARAAAALPLTRFHGVLGPRAKLRPRIVPRLPDSVAHACQRPSPRGGQSEPRIGTGQRPPLRDKTGPIIPAGLPVSATALARSVEGAVIPGPNVLSAKHWGRIAAGLLYATTSNVPWATLLARTFEVDVRSEWRSGRASIGIRIAELARGPQAVARRAAFSSGPRPSPSGGGFGSPTARRR